MVRGHPARRAVAEAYSFCARYRRIVSVTRYASYHYRPSRSQHASACALIVNAARDRSPAAPAPNIPVVTRPTPEPPPQPPSSPDTVPGDERPAPRPTPTATPTRTPQPAPTVPPFPTPPPLPVGA